MKVLVTGCSGFLGPHVIDALHKEGYEVVGFDVKPPRQDCSFVAGDLRKLDDLLRATEGVAYVCHLAAVGDVYLAFEKPYLAASCNVTGTANLMEACQRNGVSKVVYASTWEVYGQPRYQPVDEQHPCNPDHPYNITKLAGEQIALSYDRLKGVPTIALRLGTAYGTGMRPNSVFSIFITRAMKGEPLVIRGTGAQSRQFTHTMDMAAAFVLATESPLRGQVFNIVTPDSISIKELAELITDRLPTPITYAEARTGDVPPALISATKARKMLKWTPSISFREGLSNLVESHRRGLA